MTLLRTAPVTAECIIVCVSMFAVCFMRSIEGERFEEAQREWGAVISQPVPVRKLDSGVTIPAWYGPVDLWNGQWWRIPLGAFHHENGIQLLLNCVLASLLGGRLERRWGSLRYALFLVPAIFVPLVAESAIGNVAIGLSGALCAIFGAILALQQIDPSDDDFSDESIQITLGLLLLGIPITALGIIHIANVAHVTGVLYGWFTAWVLCGPFPRSTFIRLCYAASHLVLVPVFWLATHPISNGHYLWYLAEHSAHREKLLRLAIDTDPTLEGVWLQLAETRATEGDLTGAWSIVIQGLSSNPTDFFLIEEARRLWLRLKPGHDRELAETELERWFGRRAHDWSNAIRNAKMVTTHATLQAVEPKLDPSQFPLDRPIDLRWQPKLPANEPLPAINPDRPESAVEGKPL